MSKAEILENFNDINVAYNNCGMHDSLSNMLDEFEQEIRAKAIDDFYDNVLNFEDYIEPLDTSEFGAVLLYSGIDISNMVRKVKEELKGGAE